MRQPERSVEEKTANFEKTNEMSGLIQKPIFWMFMAFKEKQEAPSGFPDAVSSAHRLKWKKPSVRL